MDSTDGEPRSQETNEQHGEDEESQSQSQTADGSASRIVDDSLQLPEPGSPSQGRRKSLKDAANILKREALKQFLQENEVADPDSADGIAVGSEVAPELSNEDERSERTDAEEPQGDGTAAQDNSVGTDDNAAAAGDAAVTEPPQSAETTGDIDTTLAVGGSEVVEKTGSAESGEGQKSDVDARGTSTAASAPAVPDKKPAVDADDESDSDMEGPPKHKLTDDFFYEEPPTMSTATVSESAPVDLVQLHHSFGFECTKRSNLQALDKDTVVFVSGNVVEIFNVHTHQQTYIRSSTGRGIGAIAVHPSHKYFAVAEKGDCPPINIYQWPSLKLFRILRNGTVAAYAHVTFSPMTVVNEETEDGENESGGGGGGDKLASVGSAPDYMLTVWDWKTESVILRCKAFAQEVYRVSFATEIEGQLTTSGMGHIRFWKMAKTFTGLKLQGEIGRFGRTEISDICGYVELPDGKVVSGTEWGNMLLWDGGLIKVEISMKGKKSCHQGMIEEIFLEEGELISAAHDGFVRLWDFETIDTADFGEDNALFEVEPIAEIKVGQDVRLKTLSKIGDPEFPTTWFAQDAAGALWKLDISTLHTRKAPERLATFHSGSVNGVDVCPAAHFTCSTSSDGCVRIQNYATKLLVCSEKMSSGGTAIMWAPVEVDEKLTTVLLGCSDGVVRVMVATKKSDAQIQWTSQTLALHCEEALQERALPPLATKNLDVQLTLKQALKPHTKPVTKMVFNTDRTLLATGSEDCTVFLFLVDNGFHAVGYVEMESSVASLQWKLTAKDVLLVCCVDGGCAEFVAPKTPAPEAVESFCLAEVETKKFTFTSVKQRLRKEEEDARLAAEEEEKRKAREAAKGDEDEEEEEGEDGGKEKDKKGDGKDISDADKKDDEKEEAGQEEEEEVEEVDMSQGKVLFGCYANCVDSPDTFILSVGGYDAGYLYHCQFASDGQEPDTTPFSASAVPQLEEKKDTALTTGYFSGRYFFAGTGDGNIRVYETSVGTGDKLQLCFDSTWSLAMHDVAATVHQFSISFDGDYLLSTGSDSNFFVYRFGGDKSRLEERIARAAMLEAAREQAAKAALGALEDDISSVRDIEDPTAYSIEEAKQKAEHDRRVRLAEKKKLETRRGVELLRREFRQLYSRNEALPSHMAISKLDFQMDPLIQKEVERTVEQKIEQIHDEFAWETEKTEKQLQKLRDKFKTNVETEHMLLRTFDKKTEVSTYRLVRPLDEIIALAESTSATITTAEPETPRGGKAAGLERSTTSKQLPGAGAKGGGTAAMARQASIARKMSEAVGKDGSAARPDLGARRVGRGSVSEQDEAASSVSGSGTKMGSSSSISLDKALQEAEQRKAERLARQQKWAALNASKPDEHYQDPDDVRMINDAKANMGDFKLKTASDYVVSEEQRVNAHKKQQQLAQTELLIYQYKKEFNQMLLELRSVKQKLIDKASSSTSHLTALQSQLPSELRVDLPTPPNMDEDETPEKKLEVSKEELLEFKATQAARDAAKKAAADADGGGFGGFGGFGGGGAGSGGGDDEAGEAGDGAAKDTTEDGQAAENEPDEDRDGDEAHAQGSSDSVDGDVQGLMADEAASKPDQAEADEFSSLSQLQLEEMEEQNMRIVEERDVAVRDLTDSYRVFDRDVGTLQHRKLHLDNCIKQAELGYIITYEEFQLLKDFETREHALTQKLDTRTQENLDMQEKVSDVEMRYLEKKDRVEDLLDDEKQFLEQFQDLVPDSNKHYEHMLKVFKKKLKRDQEKKIKDGAEDDDLDEDDDEDDEDTDDDDELDEDEEEIDDTVCPPGFAQETFEAIYSLRLDRAAVEEAIVEEKKQSEVLRKELETLKKKAKITEGQVKTSKADIDAFQREKQAKINELNTVVVLDMDQIKYGIYRTTSGAFTIQSDLSGAVVFPKEGLPRLKSQIEELQRERVNLRNQQKENRVYQKKLAREKTAMLERLDSLESQLDRLMVLKFGRVVDLDKLETAMVSKNVEELKEKLDIVRKKNHSEVLTLQNAISQAEDELTLVIRENTRKIGYIRQLCAKERELGKKLEERCARDAMGPKSTDRSEAMKEEQRLNDLMGIQRDEIQGLRDEISMLQRKGAIVHAPHDQMPRRPVPLSKRPRLQQPPLLREV